MRVSNIYFLKMMIENTQKCLRIFKIGRRESLFNGFLFWNCGIKNITILLAFPPGHNTFKSTTQYIWDNTTPPPPPSRWNPGFNPALPLEKESLLFSTERPCWAKITDFQVLPRKHTKQANYNAFQNKIPLLLFSFSVERQHTLFF